MIRHYHNPWPKIVRSEQVWRRLDLERLVIEIGAGQGLHAIRYCFENADTHYIAIERTQVKYQKLFGRHYHHPDLKNLTTFNVDAVPWISQNINQNEVDAYFILYPNPYPKKKQANKRWHHMPFMSYLHETLKKGGQITLATNIKSYFQEASAFFAYNSKYELEMAASLPGDSVGRTHFEKKYLANGERCYQIVVNKR